MTSRSLVRWGSVVVLACLLAGLVGVPGAPAADSKEPPAQKDNSNALLKEYRDKVKISASTFYGGWPAEKAIDGNLQTSWFTATGDAAAKGTKPWIELELPCDETVKRVTIMGNREPSWLKGYTILAGTIEFLDKDRKPLWADEMTGAGPASDFDFRPKAAIKGVRYIRFTSTKDEGNQNPYDDVAIAEILVE